jgi:hypothetical protein
MGLKEGAAGLHCAYRQKNALFARIRWRRWPVGNTFPYIFSVWNKAPIREDGAANGCRQRQLRPTVSSKLRGSAFRNFSD